MLFVATSGSLEGSVGIGALVLESCEEAIAVSLSKCCHLRCLQHLASLLDDGGDGELANGLPEGRCSLFNRLLQVTGQPHINPGVGSRSWHSRFST